MDGHLASDGFLSREGVGMILADVVILRLVLHPGLSPQKVSQFRLAKEADGREAARERERERDCPRSAPGVVHSETL